MITNIYLLICVGIFIYIQFISKDDKLTSALKLGAFYPPNVRELHQYWRMITCNFIHIDILHIFMNMYAFYDLGHFFELIFTPQAYLFLIIVSMLLSSLLTYTVSEISSRYDSTVTFGASGVVFGFFGAICGLGYFVGGYFATLMMDFLPIIIINLGYTFFNPQISKTGHIGGFIGGIVAIVILLSVNMIAI